MCGGNLMTSVLRQHNQAILSGLPGVSGVLPGTGTCIFRGPPGLATPYASQQCFQTAYAPGCESGSGSGLTCTQSWGSMGSCYYDAECCSDAGGRCTGGKCSSFVSNNPRVLKTMTWNDMALFAKATGVPMPSQSFGEMMYLVDDGITAEPAVIVPLNSQRSEPQCSTCLKGMWQCDKYLSPSTDYPNGHPDQYKQCQHFERCFLYDTVRQDGTIIPTSVKLTPECLGVAHAVLRKCASSCGDCVLTSF